MKNYDLNYSMTQMQAKLYIYKNNSDMIFGKFPEALNNSFK